MKSARGSIGADRSGARRKIGYRGEQNGRPESCISLELESSFERDSRIRSFLLPTLSEKHNGTGQAQEAVPVTALSPALEATYDCCSQ